MSSGVETRRVNNTIKFISISMTSTEGRGKKSRVASAYLRLQNLRKTGVMLFICNIICIE